MENHSLEKSFLGIFLLLVASTVGARLFTEIGLHSWFPSLILPDYAPVGGVISKVWGAIYIFWALSMGQSLKAAGAQFWKTIGALNVVTGGIVVLWCYVFFVLHDLPAAAVTGALLFFSVLALIAANWQVSKSAAAFLIPFALWTAFATVLTIHISVLNP